MQQGLAIVKVLRREHADVIMRIGPLRPDAPLAAQVVYSDKAKIEAMVRRSMPMLKNFSEFEYGFKVRDKSPAKGLVLSREHYAHSTRKGAARHSGRPGLRLVEEDDRGRQVAMKVPAAQPASLGHLQPTI